MSKDFYEPYHPAPVPYDPREIPRYLDDELHRLSDLVERKSVPALFGVEGTALAIPIDNISAWNQMFVGTSEVLDVPDGSWDSVAGEYTVPYDGVYSIILELNFINVGTQGGGNITVYAGVAVNSPAPTVERRSGFVVGTTEFHLMLNDLEGLSAGDVVTFWADIVSSQTAQTADVVALARIMRVW